MHKTFLITAAILGAITVALGAFGAHDLKERVNEYTLAIFETAVKYQFYHVFALLVTAILFQYFNPTWLLWSGRLFITGTIFFSGSLYLLTFFLANGNENMKWLGAITPIGGLCFIAGWICMAVAVWKS
ncbi:DUF423 domain-containing protein [Panacibacter ginsenosidivorans]|uniref:DUF423 domain-containing protein n=1 Tax=Panacibacter ginsenosidivorans TaxID=1813871 RepID=A0A5B8VB77_9BACT|nr:DUF423 domain-containing protein [Panacibacter ginsenosidivorans]QEC68757.1 DUF423 domain-containing protein [Panacibacter ginsenosidivorans]